MTFNASEAEQILIGPDVCITLLRPEGVHVAIHVDAPRDWTIIRQDIRTSPPTLIETFRPIEQEPPAQEHRRG